MPYLKEQISNFQIIIDLVKDSLNNSFKIDKKTLAIFIGAIVYVIIPIDLIPDFILGFGWLDDIAVVAWISKNFHTIITTYQAGRTLIDNRINQTIEQKIIQWIETLNHQINKQYKSLGFQLFMELLFLGSILITHYYNSNFPAQPIIYIYIGCRLILSLSKNGYSIFTLLKQVELFKISQFLEYYKNTKNLKKSFFLDMQNFYDYHYQLFTTSSVRIAHQIGSVIKLTPDNEEIFNRIYNKLKEDIPKFLQKEFIIYLTFFVLYTSTIAIVRQIALRYI